MGNYTFSPDDAYRFAREQGISTKKQGHNIAFQFCPFCHGSNGKDKWTFTMSIDTGQYKCGRSKCGKVGNMITISQEFGFKLSDDVDSYINRDNCNAKYRRYYSDKLIESKDKAIQYMASRGISADICRKYEITVKNDQENVLVFPFRDESEEIKFVKYRDMEFVKGCGHSKEWCERDSMQILFGMNHANEYDKPLVITEGQIDSLSLAEAGIPNAVSVPMGCNGFRWIPFCWDYVCKFKSIVVFGDCEKDRITLIDELRTHLGGEINVLCVRREDYQGYKDANEMLNALGTQALIDAVDNAECTPIQHIMSLADVKHVDLFNQPKIATHITALDTILKGGLFMGQVILLTGQRGDGKSTFMSQLIANAMKDNHKVLLYSGELTAENVRNWLDCQISGKEARTLSDEQSEKLSAWYRNRIYLYDSGNIDVDEHEDLLKIVEKAIIQYGCELICIDNLMTVVEADSNDSLYRQQSQFVGKLAKMSKRLGVVIILVAHPRKMISGTEFTNDDVSGSADITNKVDIVMSYQRIREDKKLAKDVRDSNKADRGLIISKNRLTGELRLSDNPIKLKYDVNSRRICELMDRFDSMDFGWDKSDAEDEIDFPF